MLQTFQPSRSLVVSTTSPLARRLCEALIGRDYNVTCPDEQTILDQASSLPPRPILTTNPNLVRTIKRYWPQIPVVLVAVGRPLENETIFTAINIGVEVVRLDSLRMEEILRIVDQVFEKIPCGAEPASADHPPMISGGGKKDAGMAKELAAPPSQSMVDHTPGFLTKRGYELLCRVGGGAFGNLWLVRDVQGMHAVVKIVKGPLSAIEFRALQIFRLLSGTPPGFINVQFVNYIDPTEPGRGIYYVMDAADGWGLGQGIQPAAYKPVTLRGWIRQGRLTARKSCHIGLTLALSLRRLHDHGLIHRDLKPENVIFVKGKPVIADISLVGFDDDQRSEVGTEGYIPPGGHGLPQGDLYSLGKVLYEMLTGNSVFDFCKMPPRWDEGADTELKQGLYRIMLRACVLHADRRYKVATEMIEDLKALLQ